MNTALTPCQATGTPGELPGGRRLGTHRDTFCPCQEGHQRALPRPVGGTNGSLPSRTQRGVHTAIPACLSSRSASGPPRAPCPESHTPSTARPTHLTHQHLPPCPGLSPGNLIHLNPLLLLYLEVGGGHQGKPGGPLAPPRT